MKQEILRQIKSYAPWHYVAYRPNIFLVDYLIRTGQTTEGFTYALGEKVIPMQEVSLAGHLYSSVASVQSIRDVVNRQMSEHGAKKLREIKDRCVTAVQELHAYVQNGNEGAHPVQYLQEFEHRYKKLVPFLLTVVLSEKVLEDHIATIIKNHIGKEDQHIYNAIVYVRNFNTNTKEMIDVLTIAQQMKQKNQEIKDQEIQNRIIDHCATYAWLGARNFFEEDFTPADIEKRLVHLVKGHPDQELQNILNARDEAERITQQFIKEHALSKKEIELIDVTKEFVFLRTYRTESLYASHSFVRPFLRQVAQEIAFPLQDLFWLNVSEIIACLQGKNIDAGELMNKRKKGYYSATLDDEFILMYEEEQRAIDALPYFTDHGITKNNISSFSGSVAWKGKARGRVKIVYSANDISKVGSGDILVAVMTFPNYIPAMEKAAAFITDEGGILCHAAIVSREMKKPCIIGTKVATKVLKDGDEVEVDAEQGIVKKNERINESPLTTHRFRQPRTL